MKQARAVILSFLMLSVGSLYSSAQQGASTAANATVPPLIPFSSVATDQGGTSLSGEVSITFSLYAVQQGGEPLWSESQNNIQLDATGHYSVQLGITKAGGVPTTLFTTGEARWLGVRIAEQAEQPRVLLLSVPYALKAGDAATIGGLPPSAFMLAASGSSAAAYARDAVASPSTSPPTALDVTTPGGTASYLPVFDSASDIVNSVLFQLGTGTTAKIGIGIATPAATLDVRGSTYLRGRLTLPAGAAATASKGSNSQPLTFSASAFNTTGTPASQNQNFEWQAEPVNNDTTTASGKLNLLFGQGSGAFAETGLSIASNGQITFAAGQTFPGGGGSGTVTSVATGLGLKGGPITSSGTLTIDTTVIPQLGAVNTFTGNQTVNGVLSATSNAFGVSGSAKATSGFSAGVGGTAASPAGYGVEGVNTAISGGVGVFGSSASSAGYGVEGAISASSGGTGVYGTAPQFGVQGIATGTGNTVGVFGAGVDGLQGSGTVHGVYAAGTGSGSMGVYGTAPGYGLYGVGTSTTGSSFGVYGSGGTNGVYGTASNFGLYGVATATSGNSVGVFGSGIDGLQGSGSVYGVYATGTGAGSVGAYGTSPKFGLYGVATNTSGTAVGVFGSGVDGLQGSGTAYGVYAATDAGTAGAYSYFQGPSTVGSEGPWTLPGCTSGFCAGIPVNRQAGLWADSNFDGDFAGNYSPALLATADGNAAAVILSNSTTVPTLVVTNFGTSGGSIIDVLQAGGSAGTCTITGTGDAACTGVLKSVVATTGGAGAARVETYSVQSAENWFEDAGTAQLVNGTGRVNLESVFGQTVNTGIEYHVFLTPDGDCKGLYVSSKTASGFEVRELGGGASSIAFEYRIMAKRVGYENVRLANVTERFHQQQARSQNVRRPSRSSTDASSAPRLPAQR